MPPRINLSISRLASRLVGRCSAQTIAAAGKDGAEFTRRFSALCIRDANCKYTIAPGLRQLPHQQQQRRMQSTKDDGKSDDPAVRKIEEEIERTPDEKLAGHNIPHPKLQKSLSPEEEQGSPVEEVRNAVLLVV
ncbi:hypothetical protein KEM56_002375 [Ascosphaera pollenicola]|nr:hypothetical protein KEM56_002375 [Ascosphaera pollenicola]